ncbi:hypothetical protein [Pseudomonas sp. NPDC088444]|uniref:hypothetical protein n=1 Tax=Pseudomonas sp. NPDC088444 TaxID=3364456 RepID=UPI00384CEC2D
MVLLTKFNGSNLTFKLLQEDGIQVLHQHLPLSGAHGKILENGISTLSPKVYG